MSTPSRLTGRRIEGHSVPFFESSDPSAVPEILASEVGIRRVQAVIRASQVKAIVPGQILGRVASTNKYIAIKSGAIKTAVADTTSETTLELTGNVAFEAGDVVTITKVSGTVSKTIAASGVVYDSGANKTTLTFTAAIGAGALAVGGRVYASAATGGTAVAIASEYHAITDYDQQEAMYTGGSFLVSKLTDHTSDITTDLGGRISQSGREPGYLGDSTDTVLTVP